MAEIKIEKKKPIWPWILAALAVLLVLYFIFTNSDDNDDVETATETEQTDDVYMTETNMDNDSLNNNNDEVNAFITYVDTDSEERMGLSHNYTQTALERLTDAVEAEAEESNVDVDQELERVDNISDYITSDAYATQHADSLQVAFNQLANSIEKISKENTANSEEIDVDGLKQKAEAINPDETAIQQKEAVNAYFDKASEILDKMDDDRMANSADMNNDRTNNQNQ